MYFCRGLNVGHHLAPEESIPVARHSFGQFEHRLVGLHLPAAALDGDVAVKQQVGSVGPTVGSATEHKGGERVNQEDMR